MNRTRQARKRRHVVADWLLAIGAGWFGLSVMAPTWPPYDTLIAGVLILIALVIGQFAPRWGPIAPYKDREHETRADEKNR